MRADASPRAATCMSPTSDARLAQNVWQWMNNNGALILHEGRGRPRGLPAVDDPSTAHLQYMSAQQVGPSGLVAPKAGNIHLDLPSVSDEDEFNELQKRVQQL